jgi:hypothetical protein
MAVAQPNTALAGLLSGSGSSDPLDKILEMAAPLILQKLSSGATSPDSGGMASPTDAGPDMAALSKKLKDLGL